MDSKISGVIIDKAGGRSRFDVLIARLTTWGGNTTHSAHIACGLLVVSLFLATDCNARDLNQRFDFRIREETLGTALDELVCQTDLIVLYPHELAEKTGMNPVVGYYTAREAIEILFRDTEFSGGLTENGVIHISFSDDVQANSGEKRMKSNTLRRSLLTGVSAILAGAGSVSAQTEQTAHAEETFGAGTIDVITVTAQKRSRDLQDVPFSVSALGGEQLERLGAEGFETFAQRIPGLQLSNYATGTTQLSLRGISTGLDAADRPQVGVTVGLYLDETQLSMSANNPDLQLFDLERVEVLRGPQGTLFGAGATSGVIRLISRKPNMEAYEMTLGSEVSSTRGGDVNYNVHGVANVPLSENAGFRLLGYYDRAGGFMDNSILGLEDTDQVTNVGGRAAFLVEPSTHSSVLARIIYQEREADDESWWDSDSPFPERGMIALEPGDNQIFIADLTAELDLDFATVTAVSSYTDRTRRTFGESSGFPVFLGAPRGELTAELLPTISVQERFTQELRLTSTGDGRLEWVFGGFFSSVDRTTTQTLDIPGIEAGGYVPPGPDFGVQTDRVYDGVFDIEATQYALFADATYYLTDKLSFAAGLRYADYEQDAFVEYLGIFAAAGQTLEDTTTESVLNPRFNVSYDLDEDRKIYFQAAQGFRLGGINEPIPLSSCGDDLADIGLTGGPGAFDSDSLWNYELGLKSQFVSRRVTFNAAAFFIDYSDIQTSTRLDCAFSIILNAGELESRGVEIELAAYLTDSIYVGLNASYTDSTLASSNSQLGSDGDKAPFVPEWAMNAFVDYTTPINDRWTLRSGFDVQYVDERQDEFDPTRADFLPSYTVGNARVTIENDTWSFDLFVDNLWDERAVFSQVAWPFGLDPVTRTTINKPRTMGLRATFRY